MDDQLARVLDRLELVRPSGAGYSARCPAHEDRVASLQVTPGAEGGVVLHCHAGCDPDRVVATAGLTMADLAAAPHVMAEYPYVDEAGVLLYTVERWAPKAFKVRPGLPPAAQRVLFAMTWVQYARTTGTPIYVVEGEKDVLRLLGLGVPATCNVGGAGKWLPQYSTALDGCAVVVVADDGEPGMAHARAVAKALAGHARHVSLCVSPVGKDISDLLDGGYGLDALQPLPEAGALPTLGARTVRTCKVAWAWPRYIPLGKLVTLEGDPGDGKSTLTIDLVSRWTTGQTMPDGSAHPGPFNCLLISAEDDVADTIVPRLNAAGADLDRVRLLTSGADPTMPFDLGVDLLALEETIVSGDIKIVVLDPLSSFLPADADSHNDAKIRKALYPLSLLAARTGCCLVAVRHLSKGATKAIYAGNGSIGITATARATLLVRPHPEDPTARVLAPTKANLAEIACGLTYRVIRDTHHDTSRIAWDGTVDYSAQDLMDGPDGSDARTQRNEAAEFLAHLVTTPMKWRQIVAAGRAEGHSEMTLQRARGGVLKMLRHPRANPWSDDVLLNGPHWIRQDAARPFEPMAQPTTTTEGNQLSQLGQAALPPRGDQVAKSDVTLHHGAEDPPRTDYTESSSNDDREAELMARPRVCDVCQNAEALLWLHPWWVIRCRNHDPRRWSPVDSPENDGDASDDVVPE